MERKFYKGYIIDKSQKNRKIFNTLQITNKKTIWLGLITIYEIQVCEEELSPLINDLQRNMTDHIGLIKQEFYLHFYCGDELTVVFRQRIFHGTSDQATWTEAQAYGKQLGIVGKQLDFLTPEENYLRYFIK